MIYGNNNPTHGIKVYNKSGVYNATDVELVPNYNPIAVASDGNGYIVFKGNNYLFIDVGKSLINDISCSVNRFGSKEATIKLSDEPNFVISAGDTVQIVIEGEKLWFGYVREVPFIFETKDKNYVIKCEGSFIRRKDKFFTEGFESKQAYYITYDGSDSFIYYENIYPSFDYLQLEEGSLLKVGDNYYDVDSSGYTNFHFDERRQYYKINSVDLLTTLGLSESTVDVLSGSIYFLKSVSTGTVYLASGYYTEYGSVNIPYYIDRKIKIDSSFYDLNNQLVSISDGGGNVMSYVFTSDPSSGLGLSWSSWSNNASYQISNRFLSSVGFYVKSQTLSNYTESTKYYEELFVNSNLISDLVKRVWGNYPSIETTDGIVTGGLINFENVDHKTAIETLDKYLTYQYKLGFDEDGIIYLKKYSDNPLYTFFSSFNAFDISMSYDYNIIKNTITVSRKYSDTSGKLGSTIGYSVSDSESVNKYGVKIYNIDVGAFFSNEACKKIGDSALEAYKEPRLKASIKKLPFRKYEIDSCKIVSMPTDEESFIEEYFSNYLNDSYFTNLSGVYSKTVRAIFINGIRRIVSFIRINPNDYTIINIPVEFVNKEAIVGLYFYALDSVSDQYIEINGINLDYSRPVPADWINANVEMTTPKGFLQVKLINNRSIVSSFYLHSITVKQKGLNKIYTFPISEIKYSISSSGSTVDLELDTESNSLDVYLASVQKSRDSLSNYIKN